MPAEIPSKTAPFAARGRGEGRETAKQITVVMAAMRDIVLPVPGTVVIHRRPFGAP